MRERPPPRKPVRESPLWIGAPTSVEADVVVTERPARLELLPRITRATQGDQVMIRSVVTDVQGNAIVDATVRLEGHLGGWFTWIDHRDGMAEVTFHRPGVWIFTATLGSLADTVQVSVAPGRPQQKDVHPGHGHQSAIERPINTWQCEGSDVFTPAAGLLGRCAAP